MSEWKTYHRLQFGYSGVGRMEARPYIPGEDLASIWVQAGLTPKEGDWITRDPLDTQHVECHMAQHEFATHFEEF